LIDLSVVRAALAPPALFTDPPPGERCAAVAAVLRDGPAGAEILLIERARHDADPWSGHMALPGGRRDLADRDLLETALRESSEEVGLLLDPHLELIGRLEPLPAFARGRPAGLTIAPFVFGLERAVELSPNREVEAVIWAPITPMARGEVSTSHPFELAGQQVEMPAFAVAGRIVWGLTYRMLESLFEAIERVTVLAPAGRSSS
jgi:8-oxo-dGTP pyrophosphatase MutT (NUDIX family)